MEFTKEEFIAFLEGTLIPDLKESGTFATASDFSAAVLFLRGAEKVDVSGVVLPSLDSDGTARKVA